MTTFATQVREHDPTAASKNLSMSNTPLPRTRWMLPPRKAPFATAKAFVQRGDVWRRVGLCALTTAILWTVMFGWAPPFEYRVREAPQRDLHARTSFEFRDFEATDAKKRREQRNVRCFYSNDVQELEQLRQALIDDVFAIKEKAFDDVSKSAVWAKFFPEFTPEGKAKAEDLRARELAAEKAADAIAKAAAAEPKATGADEPGKDETVDADEQVADAQPAPPTPEQQFDRFRSALALDGELAALREAVNKAFIEIDRNGLLEALTHEIGQGSMTEIEVYPKGNLQNSHRAEVSKVRIAEVANDLQKRLISEISIAPEAISDAEFVAQRIFTWLRPQLPVTLTWNEVNTNRAMAEALSKVDKVMRRYEPGEALEQFDGRDLERRGILAGVPLTEPNIEILWAEHIARIESENWGDRFLRSLAFFGLFTATFTMLVQFLYYRDPNLLADIRIFATLLALVLVTLTLSWVLALNLRWRAEVIPVVMLAITIAIAYHIELALMLIALVCLAFTVAHGYSVDEFVILTTAGATAAINSRQIRSRTKLVNVGLIGAFVVFPTVLGVKYMLGQPFQLALLTDAILFAAGTLFACLLVSVLLPFLERGFDIQTDISLLELSDANHPLLKELVQRAPGTYNHSINVASISEAAAEKIGANGLLCRVAAYFHDVGKLRKPDYFIENQAGGVNKHDDLTPTMSTLVIIAHVKDGVEIARQHRLPARILDLIQQHHGTTMVEYFYRRAVKNAEESEDDDTTVDAADFRYPGPKPQTPEAAVMMLADTVESASRALREPTPSRIENLVQEITKKKFDDGQFDQCAITIEQLNTIRESLIKSLNAMYHARVKYPETHPVRNS